MADWIKQMSEPERLAFVWVNYFPEGVRFEFKEFMVFFAKRKENLRRELRKVLVMAAAASGAPEPELAWSRSESELEDSDSEE